MAQPLKLVMAGVRAASVRKRFSGNFRSHSAGKELLVGSHTNARHYKVSQAALEESLEDARLNAIADERAAGPFVRVSLDDL